jgi:hypothetical protein
LNKPQFGNRNAQTRLVTPVGDSSYHALQTRLNRRFSHGWQLDVFYTWSKSITDAGVQNSDDTLRINIPEYFHLNRALSNFDRTHNLQIASIVELPFGKGRKWLNEGGLLSSVLGGWQVNNILSVMSGTPFSVHADGGSLRAPESQQRGDILVDDVKILGGVGRGNAYFDPLAFQDPARTLRPGEFRFGTAGFNLLRGPGVKRWDLGVFREFRATDRVNVQFRAECFNCSNTPVFQNPGGTTGNTNVSNLQLNPDGSVRSLNGFAEITGTLADFPERQIRFGVRLGF